MKKQEKESEVIFKEENSLLHMEIRLSKRLEREMRKLVEESAGTISV